MKASIVSVLHICTQMLYTSYEIEVSCYLSTINRFENIVKQDRQRTCNLTLRSVHATTVPV